MNFSTQMNGCRTKSRRFCDNEKLLNELRLSRSRKMEREHHEISVHDKDVLTRIFSPNIPYGDVLDEESQQQNDLGNDSHPHTK